MKKEKAFIPPGLQLWIDARQRFDLSHAHVQMARELGMNPKKLGKLANHKQEPWKLPKRGSRGAANLGQSETIEILGVVIQVRDLFEAGPAPC